MMEIDEEPKHSNLLELANWKFALRLNNDDAEMKENLLKEIKRRNMAPYYKIVCQDLGWAMDKELYAKMCRENMEQLAKYDKEDKATSSSEEELTPKLWQEKLEYLCQIGDKEAAQELATTKSQDKTLSTNRRLDAIFALFRIAYFHGCDIINMRNAIEKASELIEGGGDWSARNKLKAYEAICSLAIRDYSRAASLLVDAVPTFESYELASFGTIVKYTVLSCMIALPRCELSKKLMSQGVMAQALNADYPHLFQYYDSLYNGKYNKFFVSLAEVEQLMRLDPLLHPHYHHYVREMRLKAYSQLLQAYRSLSLSRMAESFGVTEEFIEKEVARFAAAGRLQCKIDKVAGTVVTSNYFNDEKSNIKLRSEAPEASHNRGIMYQNTIKKGDNLLNRLKKLARVMDF